jgi:hypothetical protein
VPIGELALHAVHTLARNGDAIEQGRFGHPIVAVGVISRHTPLIAEENIDRRPVEG